MRKLTAFALILCMMANYVVTQEVTTIFQPGVGAAYYDPAGQLIETQKSGMDKQVGDAYELYKNVQNKQVVIGHSQGGYRGLGYANYLKELNQSDKILALICIVPPARGYTPLIRGEMDAALRLGSMMYKIANGFACASVDPVVSPVLLPALTLTGAAVWGVGKALFGTDLLFDFLIYPQIAKALVADFNPASPYITKRINPDYSAIQGHWEQRIIGYRNPPRPRPRGDEWDPEIEYQPIPIYQSVWVIDKPAQITQTKMPPSMKLGFITGNQKDMFDMIESQLAHAGSGDINNDTAKQFMSDYNATIDVLYFLQIVCLIKTPIYKISSLETIARDMRDSSVSIGEFLKANGVANAVCAATNAALAIVCYATLQIPLGVFFTTLAAGYTTKSIGCFVGADTAINISQKYNSDLLLTSESDGFIPTPAQSRSIEEMGCKRINGEKAYVVNFNETHLSILRCDEVWGQDGDYQNPKDDGYGLISIWMRANGYEHWTENYMRMEADWQIAHPGN